MNFYVFIGIQIATSAEAATSIYGNSVLYIVFIPKPITRKSEYHLSHTYPEKCSFKAGFLHFKITSDKIFILIISMNLEGRKCFI